MHSSFRRSPEEKHRGSTFIEPLEPRIAPAAVLVATRSIEHFSELFQLHHGRSFGATALAANDLAGHSAAPLSKSIAAPAAAAPMFPPVDGLTLTTAAVAEGFQLESFAKNLGTGGIGPLGIAYPGKTSVLVTDYTGNVHIFPTDTNGQDASKVPVTKTFAQGDIANLATINGKVYASDYTKGEIDLLTSKGKFQSKIVGGLSGALGLVADPVNGHLLVQTPSGIYDVDPIAKTSMLIYSGSGDGLAISQDGKTVYSAAGSVIGVDVATGVKVFDSGAISGVDGTAVGAGSLSGFLFANTNYGEVWKVDLKHPGTNTLVASGGSRGDFVSVDPRDGSLLLTQSTEVVRLSPPEGGTFGTSADNVVVGAATGSDVQIINAGSGKIVRTFEAFDAPYHGGVRVAQGDVNGDGVPDIIAGAGTGGQGRVRIFDGKAGDAGPTLLVDFRPFGPSFLGGVYVAAGDVNGDGKADLIVSTGTGSPAEVRVFDIYDALQKGTDPIQLTSFKIAHIVNGGVRVAAGDLDGDGHADIVVTNGINASVRVFHGDGMPFTGPLQNFTAVPGKIAGLSATVGDFDGDGKNDLAVAALSGPSTVHTFKITSAGTIIGDPVDFDAFPGTGGARLSVADANGDGNEDIVAVPGPGGGSTIHIFGGLDHTPLVTTTATVGTGGLFVG